ncbi:MAG: AAA family ATPase [Candidatus Margulisiibacteriota bacterium]
MKEDDICMDKPVDDTMLQSVIKEFEGTLVKNNPVRQEKLAFTLPKAHKRHSSIRPRDIYEEIGKTVYGQEEAKRTLSVILYEHLLRQKDGCRGRDIPKTNALLIGPSGCGKTLIAKSMAEVAKVPFVRIDASSLVTRGYRGGMHVEQIMDILLNASNGHKTIASRGIIFLDEIDKIATTDADWELATGHVQNELLSIIDGADLYHETTHLEYERDTFSFKDVLIIFGGSFERKWTNINDRQDLVSYGLVPELVNRMGTIIRMEQSSADVLIQMIRPAVEEYSAILDLDRDEKTLYTELLSSIIKADKELIKMGGRCVGPLVRKFFEDRLFEL